MVTTPRLSNPFPGLRPFELDQEHLFFGREGQADELLARLSRTQFLAVVGTSGSGKSSLVRAGLLPALYSGFLGSAGSSWRVAILRPGNAPICHLAEALNHQEVFGVAGEEAAIQARFTEVTLRRGALGLMEVVRQARMAAHESLLVVVDQFEELFRFQQSAQGEAQRQAQDEAAAFVKLLLSAVDEQLVPIYVVLTMRSDFLGDCAQFRGLPEAINDGQYLIPRMTREQRQAAIEGPVAVGRGTITPRLVNRLLNDMGDSPDQLPILQHALMRTWENWRGDHRRDESIDLRHYESIGGMADALSIHADELYESLASERDKGIAERLFKALTDRGLDNREVRRPTQLAEIAAICGAEGDDVISVVEVFRQSGASFLMPPLGEEITTETMLDISHESLMRAWKSLKQWLQEEQQSAQLYGRLADAASRHQNNKAALYRDPDLTEALAWQERTKPNFSWAQRYAANFAESTEFLHQSAAARQRDEGLRRIVIALLVGLSVVAVIGGVLAWIQGRSATEQKNNALNAEIEARSLTADSAAKAGRHIDATLEGLRLAALHQQLDKNSLDPVIQRQSLAILRQTVYKPTQDSSSYREWNRFEGHSDSVWSMSFSPDGKTLASASSDRTVKLWSLDGKLLKTLDGHSDSVRSVSFSPDGKTLASGSGDLTVKLWSLDGKLLKTLEGHSDSVWSVSFGSDGKTLASASSDRTVKLWSLDGKLLKTLEGHSNSVRSVSFSPDGKTLASASDDLTVKLWSLDGKLLKTLEGQSDSVRSVSFSPDGKTLASASNRTVKLWSLDGKLLKTLEGHSNIVRNVSFSPDGKTLASASSDRTVKLWSLDGKLLKTLEGHSDSVLSVSFSLDGKTLASASDDRTVKLWSLDGKLLKTLEGHSNIVRSVSFSPDGKTLASASDDRMVKLWDFDLLRLTRLSCDWGANYLIQHPEVLAELEVCHTQQRLEAAALVSVDQAKTLAERGQVEDAKKLLKMAKNWQPAVDLFPETTAIDAQVNQAIHLLSIPFQLKEGKRLAREGKDQEAIAIFKQIQTLQPERDLDPETEKKDSDPKVIVTPLVTGFYLQEGQRFAKNGEVEEAIAAYQKAQQLDAEVEITARQWNSICWFGSLHRQAAKVLFACDKGVALDSSDGRIKNSRGVARAITGNRQGAIEDFQAFIDSIDDESSKQKRQDWIKQLQSGNDPFTDEVLEDLKNE